MKIGVVALFTTPLVDTSQKTPILPISGTNKMENPFFMWQVKNPSFKSCWEWKDAHLCKKWGKYSKFWYENCTNQAQLGRKPSEILLSAIF
jgi:hypothetical protein